MLYDEWGTFAALDNDVAHINDLAARFGLVFQSDYLYNTLANEGNYRHIRFTDFAPHPLTAGLEQVVLLGAHSIVSRQEALIWTAGDTRSSSSERAGNLAVAVLAADGQVLGLGDLSFLLEPYNTLYDNDRFIANIADLLSGATRRYDLEDFPFFFEGEVDLVFAGDPLLSQDLLAPVTSLQDLLAEKGLSPALRADEDPDRDTVLLGLFGDAEVEPYLDDLGVTLTITPSATAGDDSGTRKTGSEAEDALPVVDRIRVGDLGEVTARGSALLAFREEDGRRLLLVLAGDEKSLDQAVEFLTEGDLTGCLLGQRRSLALCPVEEKESGGGEKRPEKEQVISCA